MRQDYLSIHKQLEDVCSLIYTKTSPSEWLNIWLKDYMDLQIYKHCLTTHLIWALDRLKSRINLNNFSALVSREGSKYQKLSNSSQYHMRNFLSFHPHLLLKLFTEHRCLMIQVAMGKEFTGKWIKKKDIGKDKKNINPNIQEFFLAVSPCHVLNPSYA